MPKKSKATGERPLYIASERYKWMTYTEEGQEDDPIQFEIRVRKNLTEGELEALTFEPLPEGLTGDAFQDAVHAREAEMWEAMSSFVVDWNVGYRTPSGEDVRADPPAIAGGAQFVKYVPDRIINQIFIDLRLRSTGLVKAKSSTPLASTDDTTGDSKSTLIDQEA